ncbi:MAG TPA: TonB-dependent receptor [Rhizomicrobium sp.]|nr:TonB-dependent receptor [Rhizomicrobium sp.]
MRKLILSTTIAAAFLGGSALADPENVVVTATRTPQPAERTGESISVITGAELGDLETVSLGDAIALTPGLTVNRSGEIGQPTSIGIRGAETGQTVVLLDGIRLNDPSLTDEGAVLADVLANNVDRVEILRGPQSTLYGSDAIGGVVNILTRRGGAGPFALDASAEGGSFDTYHVNAGANGTVSGVEYGAAANFYHTNGISTAASGTETDGYTNLGLTGNLRLPLGSAASLDLRGYYTNARDDFDDNSGFVPPFLVSDSAAYGTSRFAAGYAGVNFDLFGGALRNRAAVTATRSTRDFFDSAFDIIHKNSADMGNSLTFEYQGTADISPGDQLVFGAQSQRLSFTGDSFSSFFPASHDKGHSTIDGVYAQYQKTLGAVTMTGGVRYDRDSQFGSRTSLKLAGAWQATDATTLRANYGDGFKAPSLFEQFSEFSNPHGLSPEIARGWEVGADQGLLDGRARASLTWFSRDTRNLIDFQSCFVASPPADCAVRPDGFYFNVGRSRTHGLEASLSGEITDTLTAQASYTALIATDATPGDPLENRALTRRPHIQESLVLTWTPVAAISATASVLHVGRRVDQYDTGVVPPRAFLDEGYTLVNLAASYRLDDRISLFGRVENALDADYQPELGYGGQPRAYFVGVRITE